MLVGKLLQFSKTNRVTRIVNAKNRLGSACDAATDRFGAHVARYRIDVGPNHFCAGIEDRRIGWLSGHRRGNHFIARAHAGQRQRRMKGTRSAAHRERAFQPEFLIEL